MAESNTLETLLADDSNISAQDGRELAFHITDDFERGLKNFSTAERDLIANEINSCCENLTGDRQIFYQNTYLPRLIRLERDFDSSLCVLRINPEIRIILSVDDDPIFGQIIVTLFRAVRRSDVDEAFNSVVETLYKGLLRDTPVPA
jgi:hypothetical protein